MFRLAGIPSITIRPIWLAIAGIFAAIAAPSPAAAVSYLVICGSGSFYVPGTTTCINANQISATQAATAQQSAATFTGVAMAAATADPFVPDNANYAVAVQGAGYEGTFAFGVAGMMRLQGNLFLSVGFAVAADYGSIALDERMQTSTGPMSPFQNWYHTDWLVRLGMSYAW